AATSEAVGFLLLGLGNPIYPPHFRHNKKPTKKPALFLNYLHLPNQKHSQKLAPKNNPNMVTHLL
ncbi:hypothetical protein, partial [Salmonella enterica]|uniref:hypothetical protein n=1 Tax=Salmonella enterica TaxID=28901 RepID=UPI001C6EA3B7